MFAVTTVENSAWVPRGSRHVVRLCQQSPASGERSVMTVGTVTLVRCRSRQFRILPRAPSDQRRHLPVQDSCNSVIVWLRSASHNGTQITRFYGGACFCNARMATLRRLALCPGEEGRRERGWPSSKVGRAAPIEGHPHPRRTVVGKSHICQAVSSTRRHPDQLSPSPLSGGGPIVLASPSHDLDHQSLFLHSGGDI